MDRWAVESVRSVRAFEGNSKQDELTRCALDFAYDSLPAPPATPDAPLAATGAACSRAPGDGVDRISSLPDQILRNVVSRLPAADAARTAALATRWRGLWRAVPLVFVDAHLLPTESRADPLWRPGLEASLGLTNAASAALAAHPGPFRCVHLTCSYMDTNREEIKRWMQLLAAKGVQQLAFINRPWPLDIPLPATVFSCASLTRLHIGAWKFPDTAALPRAAAFPHLQELYLSLIAMKDRDLAFLLDRCPVLEVLTVIASQTDVRMCVVSRSLRCLQLVATSLGDIAVAEAPRLERLILFGTLHRRIGENKYSRIKIGNAPNLRMLGYWDQGQHELQIGNTIVQSMEAFTPTGKVNAKFWHEAGSVECVEQHIKKLAIHGFRGTKSELAFLKFIAERAQVLEKMVLILSPKCFPSVQVLKTKLNPHATAQWASTDFKVILFKSSESDGGAVPFNPRISADFSCDGPFDLLMVEANLSMGAVFLQYPKIN
ncbi:hypothetical protein PR202_ga23969 [Eleusine coracana subsp. coracana]|uniref:F-box domain-containing protein n=1 Tax=Eleusine coracana subsp. coracana TaxID=191504 RepID=A0AAV5D779_ELECO|nr:hypothetical protein PR202_ga23969 [Eleusine coracana subsp. coracana]